MKIAIVKIIGTRPMLMHSGVLADKLNPWVRKIKPLTSKLSKKRTDADEEEIARLEWNGGLWYDEANGRPAIISDAIEGAIRDGARAMRQGKDAVCGVMVVGDCVPLQYVGPKGRDELWAHQVGGRKTFVDRRGAGVQKARVMRTRPRFEEWSASFELQIDEDAMQPKDVHAALAEAGARKGIGDFRPKFGLFTVEKFEVSK